MLQARAKGSEDKRWWSPSRDITVVYPGAMSQTANDLGNQIDTDPRLLELMRKLGLSREEVKEHLRVYARIIKAVHARHNLTKIMDGVDLRSHKASAVVGTVFLDIVTRFFISKYGQTIHKNFEDPNKEFLEECIEIFELAAEPPKPYWKTLWTRARLMLGILVCRM